MITIKNKCLKGDILDKDSIKISFAYVGVLVGAGLASGQELLQYFLSFGKIGLLGVLVVWLLNVVFGKIILTLASYYQADNHQEVLKEISSPMINRFIDLALIVTNFTIGFVMIAGAGSSLNQQFNLPIWLGSLICAGLIILVSFLDFDKITSIIGVFTPILIILIIITALITFLGKPFDLNALDKLTYGMKSPFSNIWISVINYYSMCAITGVSMAFVLGGGVLKIGDSSKIGKLGGWLVGLITSITTLTLFARIGDIKNSDIPMVQIANDISPIFAVVFSLVIFALIFNTGFSLFYSLSKRFSKGQDKNINKILIVLVILGYAISFSGFKKLVSIMYPILGYIGLVLIVTLYIAWLKEKNNIKSEKKIRRKMISLFSKKYKDDKMTKKDIKDFHKLGEMSLVDTEEIKDTVKDHVNDLYDK